MTYRIEYRTQSKNYAVKETSLHKGREDVTIAIYPTKQQAEDWIKDKIKYEREVSQSHLESLVEIVLNISSGFILSLLIWIYIVSPLWGFHTNYWDNLGIVTIFTVSAILRSYFWRRLFNTGVKRRLHKFIEEHNVG